MTRSRRTSTPIPTPAPGSTATPDPWGMVVNPATRASRCRSTTWPLLDSFEPTALYASDTNDCLFNNPVPYLPLVAAPIADGSRRSRRTCSSRIANVETVCHQVAEGVSDGEKLVPPGARPPATGSCSVWSHSATSTATASTPHRCRAPSHPRRRPRSPPPTGARSSRPRTLRSGRRPCSRRTRRPTPGPSPTTRSEDRREVGLPGDDGRLRGRPDQGPVEADASHSPGCSAHRDDRPAAGSGIGQLPAGYLPLTAGDGLGSLAAYAQTAAKAVAAQKGAVPSVTAKATSSPAGGSGPTGTSGAASSGASSTGAAGGATPSTAGLAQGTAVLHLTPASDTQGLSSSLAGVALPLLLGLFLVGGAVASIGSYVARRRR